MVKITSSNKKVKMILTTIVSVFAFDKFMALD